MKKLLTLLIVSAFLSSVSYAAAVIERGYISVNTSANIEVPPDVAEISIAVVTSDSKSMQKATLANKEISEKVINALKVMINPKSGDFIKTSDFKASPIYNYSGSKRTLDKYQVSNSVIVHTKSIDNIGEIIDKAISLGATNINNLSFSVSDYEAQCDQLLETAVNKARKRVSALAKASGTTVDGVRTMDVSCNANSYYHTQTRMLMANKMAADAAAEGEVSTSIESGIIKIFADLNASYFVK